MRLSSLVDIQALVDQGIPEAASLEYKSELNLKSEGERVEALKDLTGMANGGGGTVVYGVAEGSGDWPIAAGIQPLFDAELVSKLENIVRAGVEPPLLVEFRAIPAPDGYVLVVEVQPSPLGPYMIEAYGQRRYHVRRGRDVYRMSEREVRDAYMLALRARDRRLDLWIEHGMPRVPPTDDVWLIVSALPEEPLRAILDMRVLRGEELTPPDRMATYINSDRAGDLTPALTTLTRWVDGFHGKDDYEGRHRELRLHRDGAASIASRIDGANGVLDPTRIARIANTVLLYLGWFWDRFELSQPVEIRIALHQAKGTVLLLGYSRQEAVFSLPIAAPPGMEIDPITTTEVISPRMSTRARVRHHLLMSFMDRVHQAAGEMTCEPLFRRGHLYDQSGTAVNVLVGGPSIYDLAGGWQVGWVHTDGLVTSTSSGEHVGWYRGGVITDLEGDTVAVLEFASGVACPDDFVGTHVESDLSRGWDYIAGAPRPVYLEAEQRSPTQKWSTYDVRTLLGR